MAKRPDVREQTSGALDRQSYIPLYHQIQNELMERIRSGRLAVGDRLAAEQELSRVYGVSRMTARQALQGLKNSGYATSQKGRGTFVAQPKLEKSMLQLQGFTEEMRRRGMKPSSMVLANEVIKADDVMLQKLHLKEDDQVLHLRRLRLADGTPMALEDAYLPLTLFAGIEKVDFSKHSLYRTLRDKFKVRAGYAEMVLEATVASPLEAELLTIPKRASVLSIVRVLVTSGEIPAEYTCSKYRADRYRAILQIPATPIE